MTGSFTIRRRLDPQGHVHIELPGNITVSLTKSALPSAAEQFEALARWVAAIDDSGDDLVALAVEIAAEVEGLDPALVARIYGAIENYRQNPPTAEERALLEAGK